MRQPGVSCGTPLMARLTAVANQPEDNENDHEQDQAFGLAVLDLQPGLGLATIPTQMTLSQAGLPGLPGVVVHINSSQMASLGQDHHEQQEDQAPGKLVLSVETLF